MHKGDSNNNNNNNKNKNRACLSPGLNAAILWRVNSIDKGRFLSSFSKKKPNSQSIVEFYHFVSLPLSLSLSLNRLLLRFIECLPAEYFHQTK